MASFTERCLSDLLKSEAVILYNHLRTWYGNHLVLPLLQIGSSTSLKGTEDVIGALMGIQQAIEEKHCLKLFSDERFVTSPVSFQHPRQPNRSLGQETPLLQAGSFSNTHLATLAQINQASFPYLSENNPFIRKHQAQAKALAFQETQGHTLFNTERERDFATYLETIRQKYHIELN